MIKQLQYIITGILLTSFVSCQNESKETAIVEVGDYSLLPSDLDQLNYTSEDSAEVVSRYVDDWIEHHIILNEAETDPIINAEEINKRAEEFRQDLLIHELENNRIAQQLDTLVSEGEIQTYYDEHQADFQLNDYLVKVLYLKVPLDAPDVETIGRAYKLYKESDIETIDVYAKIYASNYYYDSENWIYFDDLLKEIPLQDINKDRFILKRSKIRFDENGFHYFLNIIDYKLKNSISPLNFERENIKARIINLRIKELRETIKKDIIDNGYAKDIINFTK